MAAQYISINFSARINLSGAIELTFTLVTQQIRHVEMYMLCRQQRIAEGYFLQAQ